MWRLLSFLYLVAALVLALQLFAPVPWRIAVVFAVYLLIKAWLFFPDFLSVVDGAIGLVLLLGIFVSISPVSWASIGVLTLKSLPAVFS